ncbi:5-formyltetrahydrofolate cyclo-ligase [Nesterenkonia suensis]
MSETAEAKQQVRARIRAARRALDEESRRRLGQQISQVLTRGASVGSPGADFSRVAAYLPMPTEPDVRDFLAHHLVHDGTVFLPRVSEQEEPHLEWVQWTPDAPTRRHRVLPLDEPEGPGQEIEQVVDEGPLLMLLPALAVDTAGRRLGQGGGYYDRLFSRLRASERLAEVVAWAVVGPGEVLEPGTFPVEEHDLRVEAAVTPDGLRRFSPAPGT